MTPKIAPDDACCSLCGEPNILALRQRPHGIVCANCDDATSRNRSCGRCAICGKQGPIERHHVAGRKHWPVTIPVCLSCHAILSHYQRQWPQGQTRLFYIVQGTLECMSLWVQRNTLASQLTEMLWLIGRVLFELLPYMRADLIKIFQALTTIDPIYD